MYTDSKYAQSLSQANQSISAEGKYLSTLTGFNTEKTKQFVRFIIKNRFPQFLALSDEQVIGWCDIVPKESPLMAHVGVLGMGLLKEYREQGLGSRLLATTLEDAQKKQIEKIELDVYATNTRAIHLYEKFGFQIEGVRHKGRKLNGVYDDIVLMGLFFNKYRLQISHPT
ncbi:MAG TPA: GNAT family N-acetyltransferase [Candidatus Wirthbacteria bacterium]|nr:GNAT family N-acetyltransferase [Candidatus Wirthbacteria bacterium]